MAEIRLKMSPPWVVYINKIIALFDGDPQIACNVDYTGKSPYIVLACNNGDKVTALQRILPEEVPYGGVTLKIGVDGTPSNKTFATKKELFETAFAGNPAFEYAVAPAEDGYAWFSMVYVVFARDVVQIFSDNIADAHGVISTLYQDIASEVLTGEDVNGVYFCTEVPHEGLGKPLNEWP